MRVGRGWSEKRKECVNRERVVLVNGERELSVNWGESEVKEWSE